jgi:hypothetical protein
MLTAGSGDPRRALRFPAPSSPLARSPLPIFPRIALGVVAGFVLEFGRRWHGRLIVPGSARRRA